MKRQFSFHLNAVLAIVRKDLRELLPLVLLALAIFLIQPVIASMNFESDVEFWKALQANFYWIGYFFSSILMISVLQQDPAASLNHDWLTRPIARLDWLMAKLLFLVLTIGIPVIVSRFLINLSSGYGTSLSLSYALGLEKLTGALLVPLLFSAALLAPTLRKFIFLLSLVLLIFLVPAWSATKPLLAMLGIELNNGEFGGMMWLQGLWILTAGMLSAILIFWLFYCRRESRPAYAVFCAGVVAIFLAVFPPASIYNRERAIALHEAMINSDDASLENSIILEHTLACFPAAVGDSPVRGGQQDVLLSEAHWMDEALGISEAGGLTFATTVNVRNSPVEWFQPSTVKREMRVPWRVDRVRTTAQFSSSSLGDLRLLRSQAAVNYSAPISATKTDYWLIPPEYVDLLGNDPTVKLAIDNDLALLSPTTYEIRTDGQRYDLSELGSCKAEVDNAANAVEIDCLKRGARPALVSAQLVGLPSSRVDDAIRTDFTPDWVEAFGRTHYELTVQSASLVDNPVILLTAYKVERIFHNRLVSQGVLGDAQDICPLPGGAENDAIERSNWSDKSPHEVSSVAIEKDVRVEVLDWRGGEVKDAPTLFLLPGLGATAHSYDDVAPVLAEKYNVVGMTRRGAGSSDKPDYGYDTARLSQDVIEVLDTLEIESPILIGMSIAGEELSYLGSHYPERFSGLVYLDAAYDRTLSTSKRYLALNDSLPLTPPVRPSELLSYAALTKYAQRRGRPRNIPEGEVMASYDLTTGQIKHDSLYQDAVLMNLQAPDYPNIKVPSLGIFAMPGSVEFMMEPWYDRNDPQLRATVQELFQYDRQGKEQQISRFDTEILDSEVLILEDGYHWVFLAHEQEIIAAIDKFATRLRN
jgi:pimeloyl-ACP methyl ester carboxylesterase